MDILLAARDTPLNEIVREETNSAWGHSSVVIDDIVYDFDFKNKARTPLSSVISNPSLSEATLFHADMPGGERRAEELYKELFDTGDYDIRALYNLRKRGMDGRNLDDIQRSPGLYTCSNLIAKVLHQNYGQAGLTPEFLKDIHWSQTIPSDYSNLEIKAQFHGKVTE